MVGSKASDSGDIANDVCRRWQYASRRVIFKTLARKPSEYLALLWK
jgi:hypothetical protein